MLHLQPRVHLHEVGPHVAVVQLFGDELHRAGAHITHGLGGGHGGRTHLGAARGAQARRGRFFEDLLVAALHRTIALEQVDAVPVAVGKDLDLDVARAQHVTLHQHMVVAEAGLGLALARGQGLGKVSRLLHAPHALATAAGAGLDQHRVADALGLARQQRRIVVLAVVTGHQRHAGLFHQRLGGRLAAHRGDRRGRRADEDQAGIGTGLGKGLVFAEETVTRVHGLRAGGQRGIQDAAPLQVTLARRGGADVHGFVAGRHVARLRVGIGVDGDRAHTQAARGGGHAAGDLAAVGNQDLGEHGRPFRRSPAHGRRSGATARART